jgi:hypothetical protein
MVSGLRKVESVGLNDSINRYRQIVMDFLVQVCADEPDVEPIFDTVRDRYLILSEGWRGQERLYGVLIHLDIRFGKVWIQRNQTEVEVEDALFELGIAEGDVVRGLIPLEYRQLAGLVES